MTIADATAERDRALDHLLDVQSRYDICRRTAAQIREIEIAYSWCCWTNTVLNRARYEERHGGPSGMASEGVGR